MSPSTDPQQPAKETPGCLPPFLGICIGMGLAGYCLDIPFPLNYILAAFTLVVSAILACFFYFSGLEDRWREKARGPIDLRLTVTTMVTPTPFAKDRYDRACTAAQAITEFVGLLSSDDRFKTAAHHLSRANFENISQVWRGTKDHNTFEGKLLLIMLGDIARSIKATAPKTDMISQAFLPLRICHTLVDDPESLSYEKMLEPIESDRVESLNHFMDILTDIPTYEERTCIGHLLSDYNQELHRRYDRLLRDIMTAAIGI